MAGDLSALKRAFDEGYRAFNTVEANVNAHMNNPGNAYKNNTLLNKEWERGYNRGYWEQQQKAKKNEARA